MESGETQCQEEAEARVEEVRTRRRDLAVEQQMMWKNGRQRVRPVWRSERRGTRVEDLRISLDEVAEVDEEVVEQVTRLATTGQTSPGPGVGEGRETR